MNPVTIPSDTSAFTTVMPTLQEAPEALRRQIPQASCLPMPVLFYPKSWNNIRNGQAEQSAPISMMQQEPIHGEPVFQMNPSV